MKTTVIYLMELAGYAYVGKRQRTQVTEWPAAGSGPLPDRYRGSGKAWCNVRRKHGTANIRWRILAVVPPGGDWAAAEQQWIAWARATHGTACVNIRDGGQGGLTEEQGRAWHESRKTREQTDPDFRERMNLVRAKNGRASIHKAIRGREERWNNDPTFREQTANRLRTSGGGQGRAAQLRNDPIAMAKMREVGSRAGRAQPREVKSRNGRMTCRENFAASNAIKWATSLRSQLKAIAAYCGQEFSDEIRAKLCPRKTQ
jgi:hypothetical protein